MRGKIILAVIILILLSVFAMQNYEVVSIKFLTWSFQTSIAIVTFSTLLIGILIGFIAFLIGKKKPEKEDKIDGDF